MKSTKTDNLEVKNNEENVTAEAAETKAAAAADTSSEEKEKKKEKKKTFTVDELLAQSERIELYDEYGKKKKIKVKVKSGKLKKREFRQLWIARINAAARMNGLTYSTLMHGLKLNEINLNRKVLADMAVNDAAGFTALCEKAKAKLAK